MHRKIRLAGNYQLRRKIPTRSYSPLAARFRWVVFLSLLLLTLFYSYPFLTSRLSPKKATPPTLPPITDFVLWRQDFEKIIANQYFPTNWVKGWQQLAGLQTAAGREAILRLTFPKNFSIHLLILAIGNLKEKHHLKIIEAHEKLIPSQFNIAFASADGKILRLVFQENQSLNWRAGKVAVIIDDFGYKMDASVRRFLNLPFPITFAIIPGTSYDTQLAENAHRAGFDILIHLPMEPLNSKVENRGYTIFTRMNQAQIDAVLARACKVVPYAIGINNHMGSKATADRNTMELLTNSIKKLGLLLVDSGTNRNSVAYQMARQKGIAALRLTTYLDNPESSQTLKEKLREVVEALDKTHTAVVIGHDREETARLLSEEMARWVFQGVKFVRLNELLENH